MGTLLLAVAVNADLRKESVPTEMLFMLAATAAERHHVRTIAYVGGWSLIWGELPLNER